MKVLSFLIIVFLTPLLILLNFQLLIFNRNFYKTQANKLNVYEQFTSSQVVDTEVEKLINYFCCTSELNSDFYSPRELIHLPDVKSLIRIISVQFLLMLGLLTTCLIILIVKKKIKLLTVGLQWGSVVTLFAISILWIASVLNFDKLFINFHYLAFRNDYWLLPADANLIRLFPQQFFVNFANRIALQTVVMSAVILVTSYITGRKFVAKRS